MKYARPSPEMLRVLAALGVGGELRADVATHRGFRLFTGGYGIKVGTDFPVSFNTIRALKRRGLIRMTHDGVLRFTYTITDAGRECVPALRA